MMGIGAGFVAALVLALYLQDSSNAARYREPFLLWVLPAVVLFWLCRLWLMADRGEMQEDPLVRIWRQDLLGGRPLYRCSIRRRRAHAMDSATVVGAAAPGIWASTTARSPQSTRCAGSGKVWWLMAGGPVHGRKIDRRVPNVCDPRRNSLFGDRICGNDAAQSALVRHDLGAEHGLGHGRTFMEPQAVHC
jgi:hypothetical protein